MTFLNILRVSVCLVALTLGACKQELPSKLEQEPVFGSIEELKTVESEKQLMYQLGQDPTKQNWGTASSYYVKVGGTLHPVIWDEVEKFKKLKVGDKVNLHPSEFIACTGESDIKPVCHRLMRVYKSERRVNPLLTN